MIGGKEANRDRDQARQESLKKGAVNGGAMPSGPAANVISAGHHTDATVTANGYRQNGNTDLLAGLEGLDLSADGTSRSGMPASDAGATAASRPVNDAAAADDDVRGDAPLIPQHTSTAGPTTVTVAPAFTPGTTRAFHRLCFSNEGVLYEDSQLQIGVKSEFHGNLGRLALYFGNKISVGFSSFTVTVRSQEPDAMKVTMPKMPLNTLGAMTQVQQVIETECLDVFKKPPVIKVSYLAGSLQELTLRLPVVLCKFIEPVQLGATDFFNRWKQIGGPPREAQRVFPLKLTGKGEVDTGRMRKVVSGSRVQLLSGIDKNPVNIVAAGVLHTARGGKVGCLIRNEPNAQAKVREGGKEGSYKRKTLWKKFRDLCRCSFGSIAPFPPSELVALPADCAHDQRHRLRGAAPAADDGHEQRGAGNLSRAESSPTRDDAMRTDFPSLAHGSVLPPALLS